MFTGIIQKTGRLASLARHGETGVLALTAEAWDSPLSVGESIAVQGVCLTLTAVRGDTLSFDVLQETLTRTNLGAKRPGDRLNLERAVRPQDFLGGHLVSGHVDGVGTVRGVRPVGRDREVEVACVPELLGEVIPKGSIALDGISLTVVTVRPESFTVHLIPHTWTATALSDAGVGTLVNLETDMIGKYVRHHLRAQTTGGVTWERLQQAGFLA